jgi:hypothetical protein
MANYSSRTWRVDNEVQMGTGPPNKWMRLTGEPPTFDGSSLLLARYAVEH